MKFGVRRGLAAGAVIAATLVPAAAAIAAGSAPAGAATDAAAISQVVLVNQPPARVVLGHTFPVGVWYQSFSGGARYCHVAVYQPGGKLIFYWAGRASSATWYIWHIRASRLGNYRTTYHYWYHGVWSKYSVLTQSVA